MRIANRIPLAVLVVLAASPASAVPITTAPSGDLDRSGAVTTADLQCLLRTVVTWAEYTGSDGAMHACTIKGAPCTDPANGHCAEGFGGERFCAPPCLGADVPFDAPVGTCPNTEDPPPVNPAATCYRSVPMRLLDLNCDGRLGSADLSFLAQLLLRTPPDVDGDGALNFCDPDSDGDGALDTADCEPLDETVYPGAPELCDNKFNGCPPGGTIDLPPYEGDPACALRYGPLVYGYAPTVLVPAAQVIVVGAFFDLDSTEVRLDGVLQTSVVTSATQLTFQVAPGTSVGKHVLAIITPAGTTSLPVVVAGVPTIGTIEPAVPVSGGEITITGQDLIGATVTVCGFRAQLVSQSVTELVVKLDPYTPAGQCLVSVSTALGGDDTIVQVELGPPYIEYATPNPVLTGEILELVGANLTGATVTIGGQLVQIVAAEPGRIAIVIPTTLPQDNVDIVVTTPAGTATVNVYATPVPLGGPVIGTLQPDPLVAGENATITGDWLKGATITIGGTPVQIVSETNNQIVFTVPSTIASGTLSLVIATTLGVDQQAVTVVATPTISGATPSPATAGQMLAVVGTYLGSFTSVTVGGVPQVAFIQSTATKLVFILSPTTPIGTQNIVVTTPGGTATFPIEVAPENTGAPEILDITPSSAKAGDTITITGSGFAGASWTIGGVPHTPKTAGNDLIVELVLDADVEHGDQNIAADKGQYGNASGSIFVILAPPRLEFVRASAVGDGGRVALAFLPGAVTPGAAIDIGYGGGQFRTILADDLGAAGTLFDGLAEGAAFTFAQSVPGNVSDPIAFALPPLSATAPPAPHPYLVRAELRAGTMVEVFGPSPAFGDDDDEVFVVGAERMATATAASLHQDPSSGLVFDAGGATAIGVFVLGDGASPVMSTTPIPLDLPVIPSAPRLGRVCLAGLAGGLPEGAEVTVGATATTSSGDPATVSTPIVTVGSGGTFFAAADITDVGVSIAAVLWDGLVDAVGFQASTPEGLLPLPLTAGDLTIGPGPGGTTVSLAAVPKGRLVIVAAASGDVVAGEGSGGPLAVTLPVTTSTVYVFLFDPAGNRSSPCVAVGP